MNALYRTEPRFAMMKPSLALRQFYRSISFGELFSTSLLFAAEESVIFNDTSIVNIGHLAF